MAYGKNKGLLKGGKKGQKKKMADSFLKKVWYNIKAPSYFKAAGTKVGRTCVTKTTGQKIETDGLKGRICEFNVADLHATEDNHKKIKLEVQEIQGKNCLTDFHGLSLTRDKMCQMIKKRHSLIEAQADCKTSDGYIVRVFVIAFTKDIKDQQVSMFTYAQSAQIKKIRKKIVQVLQTEVGAKPLSEFVKALLMDKIEGEVKRSCERIYPLDPVHIQKVKIVKKPKMDITKLMEIHDAAVAGDDGVAVDEPEEAVNTLTAEVKAA